MNAAKIETLKDKLNEADPFDAAVLRTYEGLLHILKMGDSHAQQE